MPVLHQKGLREQNTGKIQKLSTLEICTTVFTICRQLNFLVLSLTICTKLFAVCRLYYFLLYVFHYLHTVLSSLLVDSFFPYLIPAYIYFMSVSFIFCTSHPSIRLLMDFFGFRVDACFGFCTCSTVCSHALTKCGIYTTDATLLHWFVYFHLILIA